MHALEPGHVGNRNQERSDLADDGSDGCALNAHLENEDKNRIQDDISVYFAIGWAQEIDCVFPALYVW